MRMSRFRVQNYKNVDDTGWVSCGELTGFVGKNESGKSAIFRGLSKLNPSDGEKYYGLKEFPRRRYTLDFKNEDWPVSSVEFELSDSESQKLAQICPFLKEVEKVICTRHYSWKLDVEFLPKPKLPDVSIATFINLLKGWHSTIGEAVAPEGKGEQLAALKNGLLQFLTGKIQQLSSNDPSSSVPIPQIGEVRNYILSNLNEQWQKDLFAKITTEVAKFEEDLQVRKDLNQANKWVESNLPNFIYFEEYNVIDSAIHIPNFIQQMNQTPSAPRVRTTKCLFEHVGLDIQFVKQLDPNQPNKTEEELRRYADERAILMSSASDIMTQKFSDWWEQRQHRFRYQVDGAFFRVWVSDNLDPSEIELDQRSRGMQYFFSFYLVFLVEAKGVHRDSILLLDEPGLHVHGTAQQKIVKFLENLAKQNQLLYSTHSPFMIDGDHLENVRVVYEGEDGTASVSEDVWPRDEDSLFPLQAGLGYSLAQTLFYSKKQVVVEGLTDYWLLKEVGEILSSKEMTSLRNDAVIVPSGGVSKLLPLASMLLGHEVKVAILLDGDEPGRQKGKEAERRLLVKCLFMSDFAGMEEAELEDLFPESIYLNAVGTAYPKIQVSFEEDEKQIKCISKRIQASFQRRGHDFEKWRPARALLDLIQKDPNILPMETLSKFEAIFKELNKILK